MKRPIHEIANDISLNWKNVNYAAEPYLQAMHRLSSIDDNYGFDSAKGIILRFFGNARGFKGDKAKALKAELKGLLKSK